MEQLKLLRKQFGITMKQLGKEIGLSESTISLYESGKRQPDPSTIRNLASFFGVSADYILGIPESNVSANAIRVPVLGTIPAGIPLEAIEDVIDQEAIPADMARGGKEYIGLKVSGDSMSPVYLDGDVLILRVQDACDSGQDCAVMVNGEDATFKRVYLHGDGITLQPLNPAYTPIHYTADEVNTLPVRILGVVVELRRKI